MMSLNTNIMAQNTARNLNGHFSRLAVSTQRLSSGLRVNSSADDAAGLAIRELMRADVAALHQGVRNSNDAISLIQTADGALGIIDEKLVRMKELAEQASTGTYDSTQRLMIDSEFQAMAREISRIANSTDFNGIHLLDGSLESDYHSGKELESTGKLKVHFGTANDSAEDYYYLQVEDMTAEGLSLGDGGTVDVAAEKMLRKFGLELEARMMPKVDAGEMTQEEYDAVVSETLRAANEWTLAARRGFANDRTRGFGDAFDQAFGIDALPRKEGEQLVGPEGFSYTWLEGMDAADYTVMHNAYKKLKGDEKEKWQYAFLRQAVQNMGGHIAHDSIWTQPDGFGMDIDPKFREDVAAAGLATTKWFDGRHTYAGKNIRTQENAQHALEAVNDAIIIKDKQRAALGASQNRLENTISNLTIQGENLQAAESRISDVDVSREMTDFTRSQILTQAGTSMLSQANSMPQMLMNLIG